MSLLTKERLDVDVNNEKRTTKYYYSKGLMREFRVSVPFPKLCDPICRRINKR